MRFLFSPCADLVHSNLWSQCLNGPGKSAKSGLNSLLGVVKTATRGRTRPNTTEGRAERTSLGRCSILEKGYFFIRHEEELLPKGILTAQSR